MACKYNADDKTNCEKSWMKKIYRDAVYRKKDQQYENIYRSHINVHIRPKQRSTWKDFVSIIGI